MGLAATLHSTVKGESIIQRYNEKTTSVHFSILTAECSKLISADDDYLSASLGILMRTRTQLQATLMTLATELNEGTVTKASLNVSSNGPTPFISFHLSDPPSLDILFPPKGPATRGDFGVASIHGRQ
ncbi:hypothetical protein EVAR_87237_1 [Eumeta japonica]|uniref:Uncharacterized protein n=1 Tax=Eumeta variegata TaxID=151549 RepID=A0A4C1YP07_EUMVA|nr:hypothetical protein EVAR_87237_1 [Eumeta japonica]